jgi:hypothetical protein
MLLIAELIDTALVERDDASLTRVRQQVESLAAGFPLYPTDFGAHRSAGA